MHKKLARIGAALLSLSAVAPLAHSASEIKIGFLTTLSGPGGALGADVRDGFQLAITHSGQKLGGLPVQMNVVDDQQNPQTGRQSVERFLKRDKVDLVTGVVFSNVLLPVLPDILKNETFYLSTNTGPRDYAAEKCNKYFFATAWQNEDIPAAMGKFATDKGYKRVAVIAPNYPGGRESAEGFKRLYKGQIVEEIYTKLGQLDYAAELATIRQSKPDALFFFLPGGMGINFIKQFDGSGLNKQMALLAPGFSADDDTIRAVGDSLLGTFNSSQWAADLKNDANARFVADFTKTYGRPPTLYAAQAYDTAMLIDSAVRKVKGKIEDRPAFHAALKAADFSSIRGSFKFNNNQYPIQNLYMREVIKGPDGKITTRMVSTVLTAHADAFASQCPMK